MPGIRRWRNAIGPVYAIALVIAFLINTKVGIAVAIVGAMLTGLLWTMLSGPSGKPGDPDYVPGRDRSARREARAARRDR